VVTRAFDGDPGSQQEGKLKLSWVKALWAHQTHGAVRATDEQDVRQQRQDRFHSGPSMPAMGSQIATELAAGQPAASDVYIGAESYLVPLVKRKIFLEVEWPNSCRADHAQNGRRRQPEPESVFRIAGTPYNKIRVPKNDTPKTLKDFLNHFGKQVASTPTSPA